MNPRYLWTCFLLLWLVSPGVWGWSANGHADIAIAALESLPKPIQEDFREILMAGPWTKGNPSWRTATARAAVWPDRVRDMPLRKLFGQYGSGKVPPALQAYRKQSTSDWHYTNALFVDESGKVRDAAVKGVGSTCPPPPSGALVSIWPYLFSAYQQTKDPRDRAMVLAFLLHLVADAYQPLHLLGSLNADCRHDRGGNAFCVAPLVGFEAGLRCRDSLHFLWDQGFGAFAEDVRVGPAFRGDVRDLSAALAAVRRIAPEVYPAAPERVRSATYKHQSRRHVESMAQLASAHLAAALKSLALN